MSTGPCEPCSDCQRLALERDACAADVARLSKTVDRLARRYVHDLANVRASALLSMELLSDATRERDRLLARIGAAQESIHKPARQEAPCTNGESVNRS